MPVRHASHFPTITYTFCAGPRPTGAGVTFAPGVPAGEDTHRSVARAEVEGPLAIFNVEDDDRNRTARLDRAGELLHVGRGANPLAVEHEQYRALAQELRVERVAELNDAFHDDAAFSAVTAPYGRSEEH